MSCCQVTDLMVPLLKFYFHEEVRRAAVAALPHLLRSAQAAAEKGVPGASKVRRCTTRPHTRHSVLLVQCFWGAAQ
jgi:hypothetical protein